MTRDRLQLLTLAALMVGSAVLFFADATWLRLTGAVVLIGFIAAALFVIATPEFLQGDREEGG